MFVLLFSGPPRFRERDVAASLHGEIDGVVVLHTLVWLAAGIWVFYQLRFYFQERGRAVGFRVPQKLGLALVAALGLSIFVSVSPALTAFKVYQILISLLFTAIFVERYGVEATLKKLFQGSALLCVALPIALLINPDTVMISTETGAPRLRGDYIASAEGVAILCLVLLLGGVQKLSKWAYGFFVVLCCALLVASVSRGAYLMLFVVFLLVLLRRPRSNAFRGFAWLFGTAAVIGLSIGATAFFEQYRDPQTISTLSDRTGLWAYLSNVTLSKSPLLGFGYYAASRVYALEYNPELGTAHSMFFETLIGGGLIAATILVALCAFMSVYAVRIFFRGNTDLSFLVAALFLLTTLSGFMGATFDSGPTAMTFWSLAAILPILHKRLRSQQRLASASRS